MGTAEAGSAKWIAKQMKKKGLQRLRWFCQACEKQCRDEHGFKLHVQSPSHLVKAEELKQKIPQLSVEFENHFVAVLRSTAGRPESANKVYNEMIRDKQHVRMSATHFRSLTHFVKHLADKNVVQIRASEPELVIEYVDRQALELLAKQKQQKEAEKTKEKAMEKQLVDAALEAALKDANEVKNKDNEGVGEVKRTDKPKISFKLRSAKK